MDLSGWTEEQVKDFLRTAHEDEIRTAVRELGVEQAMAGIFTGMAARFSPNQRRSTGQLLFVLTDAGAEHRHALDLGPAGATVAAPASPRATITMDLVRFLQLGVGAADAGRLLLTRRMRVAGDRLWTAVVMRGLS